MANEVLKIDSNYKPTAGAITDNAAQEIRNLRIDDTTKGLKVMIVGGVGAGTVTSISQGTGILATPNPIIATGTIALSTPLQPIASLTGNSLKVLRVNVGETAVEYASASVAAGGLNTQLQYNSTGSLAGISGATTNGTIVSLTNPLIGGATITTSTINGNTITTGTGVLTLGAGKTVTVSNTLTFTGTDSSSIAFGAGGTVLYNGGALGTPSSGVATNLTGTATALNIGGNAATATLATTATGANALYSATTTVNVNAATAPTTGQVLTATGGTAATWQTPAATVTPTVKMDTIYENSGRFSVASTGGGGGGSAFTGDGYAMSTSATISSSINISHTISFGSKSELGSPIFTTHVNLTSIGTDVQSFIGIGAPTVSGAGITYTDKHIGFKITRASSGTINLFGTQADGTTENATAALTTVAATDDLDLFFKVNASASVDYYWRKNGGALSAATNLTTNIPTNCGGVVTGALSNVGVATNTNGRLYSSSYER